MSGPSGPLGRARRRLPLLGAIVVLLAWGAYGIALLGDYVFDDVHSVAANPALRGCDALGRLLVDPSAFSATGQRMYRPVLLVSFALNLAVSPAAWSLKAGNVLLHSVVAWLLFGWLRRLSVQSGAAFAAAALFAVHPLCSEAVNLVSARSELLLALGLLIGMRSHLAWHRARAGGAAVAGMLAGTVIACGSKETGVVLPALMLAQAWWVGSRGGRGRDWRRAVVGVLPAVALVLGYLVLRKVLLGQATVDLLARSGGDPTTGHGRTLLTQLATMGTLLPRALLQVLLPFGLTLDPPVVFRAPGDPWAWLGWSAVALLAVTAAWPGATAPARRLGLTVATALALPWIVVPLNMPLAEHRLYGPMLGIALATAALVPRRRSGARPAPVWWRPALLSFVVLVGAVLAARRSWQYRDEVSLWQAELAARPSSFQAWWGLGAARLRGGDFAGAIEPLATAHTLRPAHFDALRYYVEALVQLPDAQADPYRSLAAAGVLGLRAPDDPWVRTLQAEAHLQAARRTGDREHCERAEGLALSCLQIAEPKAYVYRLAAAARRQAGDLEAALAHLDASIARGLDHMGVRLDRAALLRELGRSGEARRELLRAQREAPMDPAVLRALHELAEPPR